jgi:thiamine-monophosphate kinase
MESEEKLLKYLANRFPARGEVRTGIGDDAAVIRTNSGRDWVVTTDQLVENTHFRRRSQSPGSVGWKALARSLSDVAAMGARPRYALVALALPRNIPSRWVREFFAGIGSLARQHKVQIIGGDLAAAQQVVADVQVIGDVHRGKALLRSGARPGQALYVSGRLGFSALGQQAARRKSGRTRLEARAIKAHFYPQARVGLAQQLARRGITALMDLSDGLSTDLHRLCRASGVGAQLFADSLPAVEITSQLQKRYGTTGLELALHGGEDYELLFTAPPGRKVPRKLLEVPLTQIGVITKKRGVYLENSPGGKSSRSKKLAAHGWDHFRR